MLETEIISKFKSNSGKGIIQPNYTTRPSMPISTSHLQIDLAKLIYKDKTVATPIIKEIKVNFVKRLSHRLTKSTSKPLLIAITGESASGKTTICNTLRKVSERKKLPVEFFSTDNYFNDISELIKEKGSFDNLVRSGFDSDSPNNFQLDLLAEDLTKLSQGKDILSPLYRIDGTGVSVPAILPVKSKKIIVVEGMCTGFKAILPYFDVMIYTEADENARHTNFIKRAKERNQPVQDAKDHWNYVNKAAEKYIRPSRKNADIIIDGYSDLSYYESFFNEIYNIVNHSSF